MYICTCIIAHVYIHTMYIQCTYVSTIMLYVNWMGFLSPPFFLFASVHMYMYRHVHANVLYVVYIVHVLTCTMLSVCAVTGSEKSPPGGLTAPTILHALNTHTFY